MQSSAIKIVTISLFFVVLTVAFSFLCQRQAGGGKLSRFGEYRGYSEAVFDGSERRSEYLKLSNGTRLAYDLIIPTKKGIPANKPLPVLFKYTPYLRTFTIFDPSGKNIIAGLFDLGWKEKAMLWLRSKLSSRGHLMDPVFRTKYLENMLKHGYAVIVVERPGTGASFGLMDASFEVAANPPSLGAVKMNRCFPGSSTFAPRYRMPADSPPFSSYPCYPSGFFPYSRS